MRKLIIALLAIEILIGLSGCHRGTIQVISALALVIVGATAMVMIDMATIMVGTKAVMVIIMEGTIRISISPQ